jgi:thioredoxin reductase
VSGARVLEAQVGIVGAGPGGMAAALHLARAGVTVVLLDEGFRAGGQIYRQLPDGYDAGHRISEPPSHRAGNHLLDAVARERIRIVHGATVWNARPGQIYYEQNNESWLLACEQIVLAPGAYDRCVPFPGWTLPGVITAGAAQVMVRGFAVAPGQRALVCGTGPLLLPTVTALASAGVKVVAALEAAPRAAMWAALRGVIGNGARMREALFYARSLLRRGIRLQWGASVFAAEGDGRVQSALIGKLDQQGAPRPETARRIEVDVICAGFGLVPAIELGLLLSCAARYDAPRGGHCLVVDEQQRTSVDSVYAVGEIVGIGGAEVAMAEGRVAGAAIAARLASVSFDPRLALHARSERRAADAMLRAFQLRPGLFSICKPDTVVCRCEDVTSSQAAAAGELYGRTTRGIKMGCRAGMGPCQARICGLNLHDIFCGGGEPDLPVAQVPVKPVRTATMIDVPRR